MWKENIWRKKDNFCGGKEELRRKGGKYLERENVTMAGQTTDMERSGFFWAKKLFV